MNEVKKTIAVKKMRLSNYELLRIFAIIFIIIFHFAFHSKVVMPLGTTTRFITDIFYMLGELGVNLFVLIAGYFGIKGTFKREKFIALILESIFYLFLIIILGKYCFNCSFKFNIKLIELFFRDWWFFSCYLVLYIISPYINKLCITMKKEEFEKLILTLLICFSILPSILGIINGDVEIEPYYSRFSWMVVIYVIGAYIQLYDFKILNSCKKCIFNVVLSVILVITFIGVFSIIGENIPSYLYWTPNALPLAYLSVSIFCLTKYIKIKNSKIINTISSCTLGIYLLHDNCFRDYLWNFVNSANIIRNFNNNIEKFLLIILSIFLVGVFVDLIRQGIIKFIISIFKMVKNERVFSNK